MFIIIKEDFLLKYGFMWLNCSYVRNKYFYLEILVFWYILSILIENYIKIVICVCVWNMRVDFF